MESKVTREVEKSERSYKLLEDRIRLGNGSYGTVVKGELLKNGKRIAVKYMHLKDNLAECLYEVSLMEQFDNCKNVVQLIESCKDEASLVYEIAMELAQCSLNELMRHPEFIHGLSENVMKDLIQDSLHGLEEIHSKRIGHRDIKPDNMLVFLGYGNKRFSKYLFKYSDFGVSKVGSLFSSLVGTRCYLPPPMAQEVDKNPCAQRGDKLPEPYTREFMDLWCLGCTIIECTMGKVAFPNLVQHAERLKKRGIENPRSIWAEEISGSYIFREEICNKTYSPWFKVFVEILGRLMLEQIETPSLLPIQSLAKRVLSIETSTLIVLQPPNECKMFSYADLTIDKEFQDDWKRILHEMFGGRQFYALSESDVFTDYEKEIFNPGQDYVILPRLHKTGETEFANVSTLNINYSKIPDSKIPRRELLFRATTYNNEADMFLELHEKLLEIVKNRNDEEIQIVPDLQKYVKECKLDKKIIVNIKDDLSSVNVHEKNQEGKFKETALYTEHLHKKCQERHKAVHEQLIQILNGTNREIGLLHYLQQLAQKLNELETQEKQENLENAQTIEIPNWMRDNHDQINAFYKEKKYDEAKMKKVFNFLKTVPVGISLNPPVTHL